MERNYYLIQHLLFCHSPISDSPILFLACLNNFIKFDKYNSSFLSEPFNSFYMADCTFGRFLSLGYATKQFRYLKIFSNKDYVICFYTRPNSILCWSIRTTENLCDRLNNFIAQIIKSPAV